MYPKLSSRHMNLIHDLNLVVLNKLGVHWQWQKSSMFKPLPTSLLYLIFFLFLFFFYFPFFFLSPLLLFLLPLLFLCCYTHPKKWPQWGMLLLAIPISKWQLLMCAHCTRMTSRRWEMPFAKASLLSCWLHEGHLYNWQNLHLPFIPLKILIHYVRGLNNLILVQKLSLYYEILLP